MKKIAPFLLFSLLWVTAAHAQSSPGWTQNYVPTPAEWNAAFAQKQDYLGAPVLVTSGGTMTGELTTAPSATVGSGFNLAPGVAPTSPNNGDMWTTASGLYVQINGATIGPLSQSAGGSFAATMPLSVTFPGSVVTYALNYNSTLTLDGSNNLELNLSHSNTWSAAQTIAGLTVTGSFTATGLVTNADLVNPSTNVNGQTCTLGGACTITASAGTITVGVTTIQSGAAGHVLMEQSGTPDVLGEYNITGTGNVMMSASPTTTGTLTAAAATFSGTVALTGALTSGGVTENFPGTGNIVGTTDTQTLTNKTMSGASNTFTNIGNSSLVNPSLTINGQSCTLGTSCTPPSSSITVATTSITGGTSNGLLYDTSSGTLGNLATANNGVLVTNGTGVPSISSTLPSGIAATNMNLTTPTLGVASGTSLALGGCTIGSNTLCVNGFAAINAATTITSQNTNALTVGINGATNPALEVNSVAASSATGLDIISAAAGGGVSLAAISSATNEPLIINGKGSGAVAIGGQSTGGVTLGAGGGGVSATALTATGSFTATGLVTYADMASAAIANASNYFSGASNVLVPASVIYQGETVTTFGATTTFDFNTFLATSVTLTGNITTMNVSNVKAGQAGTITFIQDSTGNRTTVWNSIFKFSNGTAPTLSTSANAVDVLTYFCRTSTFCVASLATNVH